MRPKSITSAARWVASTAIIVGLCTLSTSVAGQADSISLSDTTFIEIILTDEGVTAVDTFGDDWYYDFDSDCFVQGQPDDQDGLRAGTAGFDSEYYDDIEARAINEVRPDDFSGRTVLIKYDEYVDGDITAWGRVTIKGWVKGDVKSFQNRVLVTSSGRVDGDIEAPEIIVREGGQVLGQTFEGLATLELGDLSSTYSADGFIVALILILCFSFVSFLLATLMPSQTQRIDECIERYRGRCFALGLLLIFGQPVIIILVIITIVGILVVPVIPLLYIGATLLGLLTYGHCLGRIVFRQASDQRGRIVKTMTGVALLMIPWLLVALMLGSGSGVLYGFGIAGLVLCILTHVFISANGIGAAALTRFGFRTYTAGKHIQPTGPAPAPAPPPIPEPPLIGDSPAPDTPPPPPLPPDKGATNAD